MNDWSIDVLEHLTHETGLEYDPVLARQAVRQAEVELPGPIEERWAERLVHAGKDMGMRVTATNVSLREAQALVAAGERLVTHAEGAEGEPGRWIVLTQARRGKLRVIEPHENEDTWVSLRKLAAEMGLANADAPSRWLLAAPLAPHSIAVSGHGPSSHLGGHAGHAAHGGHGGGHGGHRGEGRWHEQVEELSPLRRLILMMKPEMGDIRVIVMFAMAVGVMNLATPLIVQSLVETVGFRILMQQVAVLSLVLCAFLAMSAALFTIQKVVVEYIQRRFYVRMVTDFAYRLPRIRLDAMQKGEGPEIVNRFFDVVTVQKASSVLLVDGVALILTTIVGLTIMAFYHPYLIGFDLVLLAAIAFFIFLFGKGGPQTAIQESLAKYRTAAWLEEIADSPVAFKLGHAPDLALERADELAKNWLLARKAHFRIVYRQIFFAMFLQVIASTALLGLGGWLVIQNRLTLGQLVASELIVATIVGSFAKVGKYAENYYDLLAGVNKIGHVIDLPLEREGGELMRGPNPGASMVLRNVCYGDHHRPTIHNVNLTIEPGQRIGITGPIGSGKTTLLELMIDMRDVSEGQIEFDGMDLRDIRIDSLREQVSMVCDPDAVEGSIVENVRMGRYKIPLSEVRRALELAGLWEMVSDLPDEMYRRLSPGGSPLSEGELRKLMLARAMAGSPRLILIDETLDHLPPKDRADLLNVLFDKNQPWTLVVATHLDEITLRCDRVLHLERPKHGHGPQVTHGGESLPSSPASSHTH